MSISSKVSFEQQSSPSEDRSETKRRRTGSIDGHSYEVVTSESISLESFPLGESFP